MLLIQKSFIPLGITIDFSKFLFRSSPCLNIVCNVFLYMIQKEILAFCIVNDLLAVGFKCLKYFK